MKKSKLPFFRTALLLFLAACAAFSQTAQTPPSTVIVLARGVTYSAQKMRSSSGEPWLVHILRVERKMKGITIRAASALGEMRRELPTEIAKQEVRRGEKLLAVVNGDYDIAAPYLGISDGVSITSRHLWTTGKATWPALALRKNGQPLIGVPEVRMELRAGSLSWKIAALNKPLGSAPDPLGSSGEPRAYTRDYRETLRSERPFRALVIGKLSRSLPLRTNQKLRGEIIRVLETATEIAIPRDAVVIAGPPFCPNSSATTSFCSAPFREGAIVELRIDLSVEGNRDIEHLIGGFPVIVQNGNRTIVGTPGANLRLRHPRTAVCYNAREIIFVVVDGRQPQLSVGMTLEELGDLMVSLGCIEAMNTDGGGSSVMAVTFPQTDAAADPSTDASQNRSKVRPLQIVNSPSDGKERGRGNAWVILQRK